MNLLLPYFQLLRAMVPHVAALPAAVVFRRGWGVYHASFPRFIMGWIMGIPLTPASALVPGPERADAALAREITRPWQWMVLFGMVSAAVFAAGRIRLALRPPSGLSNDVGRVRFPPRGTFRRMVPCLVPAGLGLADYSVWKQLRPLSALGAFHGLMMAWDYLKARHNDRMMGVGVHDAVILSGEVMPPADSSPDPWRDGMEGGTAELVRLYGRSAGK